MSCENDMFKKDVTSFRKAVLEPLIASYGKTAKEYDEKAAAVVMPEGNVNGLLAAIDEAQYLRRLAAQWSQKQDSIQRVLADYRDHFKDYLD